jgi:hypothetical protein
MKKEPLYLPKKEFPASKQLGRTRALPLDLNELNQNALDYKLVFL